jgi:Fur family ferric uptake transcriptional regulator
MPTSVEAQGLAWFFERFDAYIEKMGLKQTQPRRVIVKTFLDMHEHVEVEELHRQVRKDGHDIGLATVYRTLNLLSEAGLVEQKSFQDGRSVFEVANPDRHHDHLVCGLCHRIVEFENHEIEDLQEKIALKHGMELRSHRLDLFGRCLDKEACDARKNGLSK